MKLIIDICAVITLVLSIAVLATLLVSLVKEAIGK